MNITVNDVPIPVNTIVDVVGSVNGACVITTNGIIETKKTYAEVTALMVACQFEKWEDERKAASGGTYA